MKKITLLLMSCLQFVAYPTLQAYELPYCSPVGIYAQILGGLNFLHTDCGYGSRLDTKVGYLVSGSLGCNFAYGFRAEVEGAYRRNNADNIRFFGENNPIKLYYQTTSLMGNFLWDLPFAHWGWNLENYQPYIGGGVGCDWQKCDTNDFHGCVRAKNGIFAWQVMAGVSYEVFCDWKFSLGYNYHRSGTKGLYNQAVTLGLLYNIN